MKILFSTALLILSLTLAAVPCFAQKTSARNSIYLELLGSGGIYSFNYDRMFTENISGRIGVMYFPAVPSLFSSVENLFIMPFTLNFLIGENSHKLELGAGIVYGQANVGITFNNETETSSAISETFTIGYRYQQRLGGFLFRIGFTPLFRFGEIFMPWGGISIGFSFR